VGFEGGSECLPRLTGNHAGRAIISGSFNRFRIELDTNRSITKKVRVLSIKVLCVGSAGINLALK